MPDRPDHDELTELLGRLHEGEAGAADALLPLVYDELHTLAEARLRRERPDHTLQPTALVHEAYLKLAGAANGQACWNDRTHFFAVAARAIRQILVDHARRHRGAKRGGNRAHVGWADDLAWSERTGTHLIALHEALERFAVIHPEKARLVELRFFAGLEHEEIATVLGTSIRTVERHWQLARAWLFRALSTDETEEPAS